MPEHAATPPAAERVALAPQTRPWIGRFAAPSGVPARRAVAALAAAAGLAAPGAWAAEPAIASNPPTDMTYTPVGIADIATSTLRVGYQVAQDERDTDGIGVGANPLPCGGDDETLSCITDGAGNTAVEAITGLPAQPQHRVEGRRAAPRLFIASSPESGGAYREGERIELALEYSTAVSVRGNPDGTPEFPELVVSVGAGQRPAAFAGGSGTPTLRFAYTVQSGDADDDGISVARGPESLSGGIIEDEDGSPAPRNFDALPPDDAHRIDTVVPVTLGSPTITSTPVSDGAYGRDEVIEVAVTLSETVHVTNPPFAGTSTPLHLNIEIGGRSRAAEFRDGSGTDTLLFAYEVVEGDYDDDGISIGPNALGGGLIEDAAGNEADRRITPLPPQPDHRVNPGRDFVPPAVAQVEIVSTPATDSYQAEETIAVDVRFSEQVHVTGEPTLEISIGMATRQADLASGSGTTTLVFHYVVVDGDLDTDGVSIGPGPASLVGGTITDAAANSAERAFQGLPADRGHTVNAGREPAAVASVRIVSEPRSYNAGDVIEVQVEFTKVVNVSGVPAIVLSIGDAERRAAYAAGTGTDTLLFRYVVQPGDLDDDGVNIPADSLVEGKIEDAAGIPAVRSFAAVAEDIRHVVDAQPPTIVSVALVSAAGPGSGYQADDRIDIAVVFDDEVHATGQPALTLSIGMYDRNAYYATGSGTHRLLFSYVVQDDDRDDDGVSISANALRGGMIEDGAGNAVDRSFSALGPFPAHTVAAREDPPVIVGVAVVSDPGDDENYASGERIEIAITFADVVHVTDNPAVTLSVGAYSRSADFAAGNGTRRLVFAYVVAADDYDEDGISIAANALLGGIIEDTSGNPADRSFQALPPQPGHRVGVEIVLLLAPLSLHAGREESVDLAAALASVGILQLDGFVVESEDANIAAGRTAGGILTVTAIAEGTTTIRATARRRTLALLLPVTVETSAEETAVLQSALASVGRGLLASVANTIGARLERPRPPGATSSPRFGARSLGAEPVPLPGRLDAWHGFDQDSAAHPHVGFPGQRHHVGPRSGLPGGPAQLFALLPGIANPASAWGVWGAVDVQAFEGDADAGTYDGRLTSLHLGADMHGDGWVTGASVSRALGEVTYEYDGDVRIPRTLKTELTTVHPYVQWSPDAAATFWTVLGFGSGEASIRREKPLSSAQPADLSMRLGLVGLRYDLGQQGAFALAVRADAGFVTLETGDGEHAVFGLGVNAQRLRTSLEASVPIIAGGGVLTPFVDLGARWDGGDGQTGGGVEVAGGIRYGGPSAGIEVKARTLALHGADGVAESGLAATVFIEPGPKATGWRLSLTPRWGGAGFRDVFWQRNHDLHGVAQARRNPGWTLDGRVGYGFGLRGRAGTFTPFTEFDVARAAASRARIGVRYQPAGATPGRPSGFVLTTEHVAHAGHRSERRLLFVAEARF